MQKKTIISLVVLSIMISSALTYFFAPKKVEYKEKIKIVEVVKTEVRSIERTEKRPDGTLITTITKEKIDKKTQSKEKEVSKRVTPIKKDWFVTGSHSFNNVSTLSIQRRIIFDLYAGVYARTDKEIGVAVSISF